MWICLRFHEIATFGERKNSLCKVLHYDLMLTVQCEWLTSFTVSVGTVTMKLPAAVTRRWAHSASATYKTSLRKQCRNKSSDVRSGTDPLIHNFPSLIIVVHLRSPRPAQAPLTMTGNLLNDGAGFRYLQAEGVWISRFRPAIISTLFSLRLSARVT